MIDVYWAKNPREDLLRSGVGFDVAGEIEGLQVVVEGGGGYARQVGLKSWRCL